FIHIALVEEEIRRACGRLDGFLEMTGALEELREFFERGGVLWADLRRTLIDLKRLVITPLLEEGQPQAVEGFGIIRHFLQGGAVGGDGFAPLLIPGGGVAIIHGFLEYIFSSGHERYYNVGHASSMTYRGLIFMLVVLPMVT